MIRLFLSSRLTSHTVPVERETGTGLTIPLAECIAEN